MEESFAFFYSILCGGNQGDDAHRSTLRTFGAIENTLGRVNAVRAIAGICFPPYWHIPEVKIPLIVLLDDVKWGAHRRNDIAHGKVVRIRQYVKGGVDVNLDSGCLLVAPSYMTGRTDPFPSEDEDDIFGITKSHYRFNTMDILSYAKKFLALNNCLVNYTYTTVKVKETNIPRLIAEMQSADPEGFVRKMRR